jgi:hypothetical protein
MEQLTCPQCGLIASSGNKSKNWSPSQKAFKSVVVKTVNVHHNCCRQCSPSYYIAPATREHEQPPSWRHEHERETQREREHEHGGPPTTANGGQPPVLPPPPPGYPRPAQPPPPTTTTGSFFSRRPPTLYAEVVTVEVFEDALRNLRAALPVRFWEKFHANTTWFGGVERTRSLIADLKQWSGYTSKASPLKFMSYFGAVPAHSGIPESDAWAWDRTGQAYFDPGNEIYCYVLDKVWPGCLPGFDNMSTKGDVPEAFLGFCWFMGHPDNMQSHLYRSQLRICDDFGKVIAWVYDHWDLSTVIENTFL